MDEVAIDFLTTEHTELCRDLTRHAAEARTMAVLTERTAGRRVARQWSAYADGLVKAFEQADAFCVIRVPVHAPTR